MEASVSRKPWRMSHRVAEDLRKQILNGTFDLAERLPPVPALAELLGISQHHLRESLRLLEQDGLVRVVSGRNGGIFINSPEQARLTRTFGLVLARSGTLLKDLMAARAVIEPAIAALAAVEASEEDLARLNAILDSHAAIGRYRPGINAEFHLAVAAATHNQTLLTTMTAMEELLLSLDIRVGRREPTSLSAAQETAPGELIRESLRAHKAILRSLEARDAVRASALTLRHVVGYRDEMAASGIDLETYRIADLLDDVTGLSFGGET